MKDKVSAEQMVYDYICSALYDRKLVPGSALVERVICEALHVGRTPVRAAFGRLAAEGYVELVPNRGAFIITGTKEILQDYYRVRTDLEILALQRSINRMDEEDFRCLNEIVEGEAEAFLNRDFKAYLDCVGKFYGHIIAKAESPVLLELYSHLYERQRVLLVLYDYFYLEEELDSREAHLRMIRLLREKDLKGMIQELEDHMAYVMDRMESITFRTANVSRALSMESKKITAFYPKNQ